ncbi:MAG: hypothetical protein RL701_3259 [Pseudomonadota bacterium]
MTGFVVAKRRMSEHRWDGSFVSRIPTLDPATRAQIANESSLHSRRTQQTMHFARQVLAVICSDANEAAYRCPRYLQVSAAA